MLSVGIIMYWIDVTACGTAEMKKNPVSLSPSCCIWAVFPRERTYKVYVYVSLHIYVYPSLCLLFLAENCKEQKRSAFPSAYALKCMHWTVLWHSEVIFAWIWHFSCGLWHVPLSVLNYLSMMADLWQSHQCFSSARAEALFFFLWVLMVSKDTLAIQG